MTTFIKKPDNQTNIDKCRVAEHKILGNIISEFFFDSLRIIKKLHIRRLTIWTDHA